jgi:hypothetical protein
MIRALFYLRFTSLRNQVLFRALRLRQPKYLAGALATAAYFYYFIFRRLNAPFPGAGSARVHAGIVSPDLVLVFSTVVMIVIMMGWITFAWVFPANKPALRFSPAEIGFLFPAPVSRRTLVHYSLCSSQLTVLFSALLLGLIWSRRGFSAEGAAMRVAGWWIILSTADLHKSAANLTFTRMEERGHNAARGRILAVGIVGLFFAALGVSFWREGRLPEMTDVASAPAFARYVSSLLNLGSLRWLLAPFRILAGPFLAPDGRVFLAALPPALLLLVAHYLWVMRQEVSFAEGSIALAETRAQALAARTAGTAGRNSARARPGPFRLAPRGRPEVAFLWKNVLAISSTAHWRIILVATALVIQSAVIGVSLSAHTHHGHVEVALVVVLVAAVAAVYVLMLGPQLTRQDLRSDLPNLDILKTYPLPGWQLVLGEMLTPVAILSLLLWLLLLAAAWATAFIQTDSPWLAFENRVVVAFCLACVVPPVVTLELIVPNAAMLLFPAWHQTARSRGSGVEMMGQRMIFMFGQFLFVALLLLPAVVTAIVLVFATQWIVGLAAAATLATVAVLAIVGGEVWCGIWWLGRRFDKLDLSMDLKNG